MEAVFLILVGAALFSQSWYILGLYADGRMMGIYVGGLGLLSLMALVLEPMLITGDGVKDAIHLADITVMKSLIILWALYCVGVGAQAFLDLEERTVGFYSVFLAVATLFGLLYYASVIQPRYDDAVWAGLSGATLLLTIVSGMMFFALGFTFNALRAVAGWFLLIGGGVVGIIGLTIVVRGIVPS